MLKTKPLHQLLSQSISPHVTSALYVFNKFPLDAPPVGVGLLTTGLYRLFTPSGALLATATSPVAPDARKSQTHAALAANIWTNYERVAAQGVIEQSLPASSQQVSEPPSSNRGNSTNKANTQPLNTLTLELSDYNLHIQSVAPRVLLCLIGPKQATPQPSSTPSLHSSDGDAVFEGPGSFKSGILGLRSGGATPAPGSTKGAPATSSSSVTGVGGGSLGILKAQAQALVDYLEQELKGFTFPDGI